MATAALVSFSEAGAACSPAGAGWDLGGTAPRELFGSTGHALVLPRHGGAPVQRRLQGALAVSLVRA